MSKLSERQVLRSQPGILTDTVARETESLRRQSLPAASLLRRFQSQGFNFDEQSLVRDTAVRTLRVRRAEAPGNRGLCVRRYRCGGGPGRDRSLFTHRFVKLFSREGFSIKQLQ